MSFEDDLRSSLRSQAADLDLRGRGATEVMHLARRRQHRARRAGAVAAVGVLGIGAVGVVAARGRVGDGVTVSSWSSELGLPDVGPLELSWQSVPGGIVGGVRGAPVLSEDPGGAIYALSTAPGTRFQEGVVPATVLYRMADDGAWEPVAGGAEVAASDLVGDGASLYALSTSPSTGAVGYDSVLSTSVDGGATWATEAITPIEPPSTAIDWPARSTLSIEHVGGASVALVATSFGFPTSVVDAAVAEVGAPPADPEAGHGYTYEYTADGVAIVSYGDPGDGSGAKRPAEEAGVPSGTAPTTLLDPGAAGTAPGTPPRAGEPARTVVTTIPWTELGVAGPSDVATRTQVLVRQAGAWVPVDPPELAGLGVSRFTTVGSELVLEGWIDRTTQGDPASGSRTFTSVDGVTWRPVTSLTEESRLLGLGNGWVDIPWADSAGAPVVRSSIDHGATWQSVDLSAVDPRLVGTTISSVDSGPLGLAAIAVDADDSTYPATSYLLTTRDLVNWTVAPVDELAGSPRAAASVFVGSDRIVVTAVATVDEVDAIPESVTLVGTPVR